MQRLGQLIENVLGCAAEGMSAERHGQLCLFQLDKDDIEQIQQRLTDAYFLKFGSKP